MCSYFWQKGYELYKEIEVRILRKFDKSYYRVWNSSFLDQSQWFSEEEIKALQLEGLKQLVEHARRNTKYYKNLPKIRSLDDLEKIKHLTKRDIRENFALLRARNVPGFEVTTSGTISRSTTVKDKRLKFDFGEQRFLRWYESPLKKVCELWGSIDIGSRPRQKWRNLYLPVEGLRNRKDAIHYLKLIEQFKPDLIKAYASPLRFLAHYALEEGIRPEVGVIQTGCEMLLPASKEETENAFQCDLYNFYGSREMGSMAQDCEIHGDLHINAERYIIEQVDGRLLFTDLLNYAMPLIRYENQDIGVLSDGKCPCGRGLPTLKALVGRSFDYLLTKNDTWINVINLIWPLDSREEFNWVESFQFEQVEKGEVNVLLNPWSESEKIPDLDGLVTLFYQRVSRRDLDISIRIVDSPVRSRSGKQITVITDFSPWDT